MTTTSVSKRILRAGLVLLLAVFAAPSLLAETVTLPVAVSAVGRGGVPFVSDVRVFNTSYTDTLTVTAVFRFNGQESSFQLAPRQARAFDDICNALFGAPSSLGAVDFISDGADGLLAVTSQLRSPAAQGGHVGMFVPGLTRSAAHPVTVLTSLVNGDSRTNIGVDNPNDVPITATIRLFDGPVSLGTVAVSLAPHAVSQYNDVYQLVGSGGLVTVDGYATVVSDDPALPLFTYAAEADNLSGDLILIVGQADVPAPAGTVFPTPPPAPSATPTPAPTPSPTPPPVIAMNFVATDFKWTINGSGTTAVLHVGQTYELRISDGDPVGRAAHGFSGVPGLRIPGQALQPGAPPTVIRFTPTSSQVGTFPFACNMPSCGIGHSGMFAMIQIVA